MAEVTALDQLLSIASEPLSPTPAGSGPVGTLLEQRNGFYAFESALHVLPSVACGDEYGLAEWNSPRLWRDAYGGFDDSVCCFGEDLFGGPFAMTSAGVISIDPETGQQIVIAEDIESWAALLLQNFEVLTGFPLAHEWQLRHVLLKPGQRLVPKQPFVLGGEYTIDNLYAADTVKSLRNRGEMAMQLRDVPDGATVRIRRVE